MSCDQKDRDSVKEKNSDVMTDSNQGFIAVHVGMLLFV